MRRTPTLQAIAATLGLMAGFAMTPERPSPLSGSVTPHAVTVVWRPAEAPVPAPVHRGDAGDLDEGAAADTKAPATATDARHAKPRPVVVRKLNLVSAPGAASERECPRHGRHLRAI